MRLSSLIPNQFILFLICILFLIIPNAYVRSLGILGIGIVIYRQEQSLNMPVPASPGFMFWFGNFLNYIFGALGYAILQDAWDDRGIRYIGPSLGYCGIGLSFYLLGIITVNNWMKRRKRNLPSGLFEEFVFNRYSIVLLSCLFIFPVLVGGGRSQTIYDNLVIGALQSIERLPSILLAIYLFKSKKVNYIISILLLLSSLSVGFEGLLIGYGRSKLLYAVSALVFVWLALHIWRNIKLSNKSKIIIFIVFPLLSFIFFGIVSQYRQAIQSYSDFGINESLEVRREVLVSSAKSASLRNHLLDSLSDITFRFSEWYGLELIKMVDDNVVDLHGWNSIDVKNVLFSYFPRFLFRDKSKGLGRDIMRYYGLEINNNIPPMLLTDAYRRSGILGIVFVYFIIGTISTFIAIKFIDRLGNIGLVLVFQISISMLNLTVYDAISAFNFYIYRIPTTSLLIFIILKSFGFLPSKRISMLLERS
jgi:hypothetical protein